MEKLSAYLPTQSLIYFLICCAGVIVFVLMIILPAQKSTAELDSEIANLKTRIEEQRILSPVFKNFFKQVKEDNQGDLPNQVKKKLSRDDISKLTLRLQQIVRENNLQIEELAPDVNSLTGNSGFLSVSISAKGEFMDFRNFLVELGTIPSMELVETINVRAIEGLRHINVRIWLAQE